MKRITLFTTIISVLMLFGAKSALAVPLVCDVTTATECQIKTARNVSGPVEVDRTLHIFNGGKLITGAAGITINITPSGDFLMDSGALIDGNVASGTGGAITVTLANGDVDLATGSIIRSNGPSGGAIKITTAATRTIDIDGLVESVGSISGVPHQPPGGGTITIVAGCALTVSDTGRISSRGSDSGADLVHLEGCVVTIFGIVESTVSGNAGHALPENGNHCNADPAAHPAFGPALNGNYTACVEIWGNTVLIDSTGTHNGEVDASGVRSDTGGPKRGWIDIFARSDITIIAQTSGLYAVHAESAGGTNQFGGLITVKSQLGKVLTKALAPATKGLALMANATGSGGTGGDIIVQAGGAAPNGEVDFTADSIQAIGSLFGGNANHGGGHISARSFNDDVLGIAPGELNAAGGGAIGSPGVVTLTACGVVAYTGTSTPAAVPASGVCGGAPAFSNVPHFSTGRSASDFLASAATCAARCGVSCSKSGQKFNDVNGNGVKDAGDAGVQGLQIHMFNQPGTAAFHDHRITDANGNYSFTGVAPGSYFVCEQGGPPAQTFPLADQTGGACATHTGVAGSRGYAVNLTPDPTTGACSDTGNDFGNQPSPGPPPFCSKQAVLDVLAGRVPDVIVRTDLNQSIQNAVNTASDSNGDGYIIVGVVNNGNGTLGGSTTQNVVIDKIFAKPFLLIGCSLTMNNPAANAGNATGLIKASAGVVNGGKILAMDLHGTGGVGWKVEGNGRELRNTGASGNSIGVWIVGNNNIMHNGSASSNSGVGLRIDGDGNLATDTDVYSNGSHGVQVTGNNNKLLKIDAGDTGKGNGGDGVNVTGTGNLIQEVDAFANTGNGISASGGANTFNKNRSGDRGKGNGGAGFLVGGGSSLVENKAIGNQGDGFHTTTSGFSLKNNVSGGSGTGYANAGCQYRFDIAGNANAGGNSSNGVTLAGTPFAAACY